MRFTITVNSTILSLTWVSCLWNVNKLSCSWLQQLHNSSKSFDFLNVSWSFFGHSLELIIGKIICSIKRFFIEILQGLIIGLFCFLLQLFVGNFWTTLFILKLVFFVTCHGFLIRGTFGTLFLFIISCCSFFLFLFLSLFLDCGSIYKLSQLELFLDDHV